MQSQKQNLKGREEYVGISARKHPMLYRGPPPRLGISNFELWKQLGRYFDPLD
jgi:hypothetical protein